MNNRVIHWFKFASPQNFYHLAGKMWPWFAGLATILMLVGLWISFFVAPVDAQQGQGYRIIFVHVPASQMSMFIYLVMAAWAGIGLAFNTRLSGMVASALAPTGALFAFLSLLTGGRCGASRYAIALMLLRVRNIILERERHTEWIKHAAA